MAEISEHYAHLPTQLPALPIATPITALHEEALQLQVGNEAGSINFYGSNDTSHFPRLPPTP